MDPFAATRSRQTYRLGIVIKLCNSQLEMTTTAPTQDAPAPEIVCVDLDGTVIKSDMAFESLCRLLRQNPFSLLLVPFWLLFGRARCKREIARRIEFDPKLLPYNDDFVNYLKSELGDKTLVLATGSDISLAQKISDHMDLFDEILASDGLTNLTGRKKLKALRARYGDKKFGYIGNHPKDMHVFRESVFNVLVSDDPSFTKSATKEIAFSKVFSYAPNRLKALIRALRPHQWVKNILIFVPMVMAHHILNWALWLESITAFIALSLCASGVYLLNDLLDLEADRQHPTKRNRPLASCDLPLPWGMVAAPALFLASALIALTLPISFFYTLGLYFLLTTFYSIYLKQIPLIDILVLAGLYTVRIIAGGTAVQVDVSEWLLVFSMFIFLSLACVKRYSELISLRKQNRTTSSGRGYVSSDLEQIAQFGSSSGYISVLVLALYVSSKEVAALYLHPTVLWLICPVLLYWISRVWLLAHRDELHEDPIVFALTDKVSYLVGLICVLVVILAV